MAQQDGLSSLIREDVLKNCKSILAGAIYLRVSQPRDLAVGCFHTLEPFRADAEPRYEVTPVCEKLKQMPLSLTALLS